MRKLAIAAKIINKKKKLIMKNQAFYVSIDLYWVLKL
jgi:hypothetical protein